MTFPQLAFRNIRGHWHRYTAYYFSTALTVLIFFVYADFIFHPDVVQGTMHEGVRRGLILCEVIIIIFAFFFMLYAVSAFLKSRQKEFGLLTLMGLTKGQVRHLIVYENLLISLLSIGTGIGGGVLSAKLFFEGIGSLMTIADPLPFVIAPKAVWLTFIVFLVLFALLTLLSLVRMNSQEIIHLLKEDKKPKKPPVFSKWLVGVCIVCLGLGYGIAWFSGMKIVLTMFPILFFTVLGTYFLFTQGSVAILRGLQNRRAFLYRQTHLLTISQLVFKMKDNARVLFMVAVLSAVVLTASGAMYSLYKGLTNDITRFTPHTFGYSELGVSAHQVLDPDKVQTILDEHDVEVIRHDRLVGIPVQMDVNGAGEMFTDRPALLISAEMYRQQTAKMDGIEPLEVQHGQTVLIDSMWERMAEIGLDEADLQLGIGDKAVSLPIVQVRDRPIMNTDSRAMSVIVVHEQEYEQLAASVSDEEKVVYYGYELADWEQTSAVVQDIESNVPENERMFFSSRVEPYLRIKEMFSLTLFVGMFVSILFFISAGSMLYFKLFTEWQDDRAQYRALSKLGLTVKELKKISTVQIGMLFFLPFLVAVVHAGFALKIVQDLLGSSVWQYGLTVAGIFFLLQSLFFLLSRRAYLRLVAK